MFIKIMFLFIALLLIQSCKTASSDNLNSNIENKLNESTSCPNDGTCFFEIIPNSSMNILNDETGAMYPQFHESDGFILKFEYIKDELPNIADAGYSELIYLEIKKDHLELDLRNMELNQVKLLFARLCFCRGATGYYNITDGHLSIAKKGNDEYHINLSFQTSEVPQIINHISETFVIK